MESKEGKGCAIAFAILSLLLLAVVWFNSAKIDRSEIAEEQKRRQDKERIEAHQDEAWKVLDESLGLAKERSKRNAWDTGPIEWELKNEQGVK